MIIINARIKELRKTVKETQEVFSSRIGLSRNFIAQIETGVKIPSDRTVKDICKEYGVNEEWLRTGEGEMFLPKTREDEIAELTMKALKDEPDSFRNNVISMLSRLTEDEWKVLEKVCREVVK